MNEDRFYNSDESKSEFDLANFFKEAYRTILFSSIFILLVSIGIALSLEDKYKASALLNPANVKNQLSLHKMSGGLSAFSSLGMLGNTNAPEVDEGIALIRSYNFSLEFIKKYDIAKFLLATKYWDEELNTIIIDESKYDEVAQKWKEIGLINKKIPTEEDFYHKFLSLFSLSLDKRTGFVTLSFQHNSPFFAVSVIENLIYEINSYYRDRAIKQAYDAINYMLIQSSESLNSGTKDILSDIIQEQHKIIAVAKSNPDYLFTVLNEPFVTKFKSSPNRILIVLIGLIIGAVIGFLISLIKILRK